MYSVRRVLGISGGTPDKVYECLTTLLYTQNKYKIILKVNSNLKNNKSTSLYLLILVKIMVLKIRVC